VPEKFFNTKTENYQISYKDFIRGKTPHTLFPAAYVFTEILL
jgi:hypothetical protein